MLIQRRLKIFAGVFCGAALSACVTTTATVFTEKASPEKALERRVELARNYVGERDWENAKRNLKLAYEIDPNNAEVHEAFALVYQSTGEFELAEESFKTAIRLDKGFSRRAIITLLSSTPRNAMRRRRSSWSTWLAIRSTRAAPGPSSTWVFAG